eukprot:jgi/Chrzof1/49/Cz01g01190.t1
MSTLLRHLVAPNSFLGRTRKSSRRRSTEDDDDSDDTTSLRDSAAFVPSNLQEAAGSSSAEPAYEAQAVTSEIQPDSPAQQWDVYQPADRSRDQILTLVPTASALASSKPATYASRRSRGIGKLVGCFPFESAHTTEALEPSQQVQQSKPPSRLSTLISAIPSHLRRQKDSVAQVTGASDQGAALLKVTGASDQSAALLKKDPYALHAAAWRGQAELFMRLLEVGAKANKLDKNGLCPLHYAAWQGHVGVVRALLNGGCDVNITDKGGLVALHYSAWTNQLMVAQVLLGHGSILDPSVNAPAEWKVTPLGHAARMGHTEMATLLIDKGAKLNAVNKDGRTALHFAAKSGRTKVISLLLAAGAGASIKDSAGFAPLHLAVDHEHLLAVHRLLDAGADPNASNAVSNVWHAIEWLKT